MSLNQNIRGFFGMNGNKVVKEINYIETDFSEIKQFNSTSWNIG
jgi:hypothetical protein